MEKPWAETIYRPAVALEFFKAAGKPREGAGGHRVLRREREGAAVLLHARQDVPAARRRASSWWRASKVIGSVAKGQIFGEMASITHAPRSASRGGEDRLQA